MDVRHLKYFIGLSKPVHMSSTAACLGISQPALSKKYRKYGEGARDETFRPTWKSHLTERLRPHVRALCRALSE